MKNNMATIWGSPGSGKTLTSVKIAKCLAEQKKNVILVSCDTDTPSIPILLPSGSDVQSLGDLLSMTNLSQIAVLRHCVPFGKSKYISLLGYKLKENIMTYPPCDLSRVKELFLQLRELADFVIVDCTSHITGNYLTTTALEISDVTLKVVNPGLKSLIYVQSQKLLLQDTHFRYGEQINVLNNVLPTQDTNLTSELLGGTPYIFPHVTELIEQYDTGQLLDTVFGRNAKQYEIGMKILVKEIFMNML